MWNPFSSKRVSLDGISVTIGRRGVLEYQEGTDKFLINAIEGNGYGIVVEEMADADLALMNRTAEQKLQIALNIKRTLAKRGILVDVYMDNRVIS